MPRSRRRHHSRSRSRSQSHSNERDREPKRRKIESFESPNQRRSVSSEPEANDNPKTEQVENSAKISSLEQIPTEIVVATNTTTKTDTVEEMDDSQENENQETKKNSADDSQVKGSSVLEPTATSKTDVEIDQENESDDSKMDTNLTVNTTCDESVMVSDTSISDDGNESKSENVSDDAKPANISLSAVPHLKITPSKMMSPKQAQKRLESEKKKLHKQKERDEREKKKQEERDEREKKKQEERDEKKRARDKLRQEKEDLKLKEKEIKDKEMELKRKEKDEREEKRRRKEQEKWKKLNEIDEKNKEKQKMEEKKQKTAAAFVNFFVPKKSDTVDDKKAPTVSSFMPFEVKSDMRLAPLVRKDFMEDARDYFDKEFYKQILNDLYIKELQQGKSVGKAGKTWKYDENADDCIMLDDLGESILEPKSKLDRMKAKYLKFHENQRPGYFGTWRKKSKNIRPRNPLGMDETLINYEVDSDEEWEEEEDGESIAGSDAEEEKENESENDYEVDNEFFVPHAYLSDDECDDDDDEKAPPEMQKAKLKLLKNQFDEERKSKTQKIKPRLIGCIWYDNDTKVDDAIDKYLQPLSILCNNQIIIKKRSDPTFEVKKRKEGLDKELIPDLLKLVHGNMTNRKAIITEFLEYLTKKGVESTVTRIGVGREIKNLAQWMKCPVEGAIFNKYCWFVGEETLREYNVEGQLPNTWQYVSKTA